MLKNVSELTLEENSEDAVLLDEGWKECQGHFYLFMFKVNKQIGVDPEGFPAHTLLFITLRKYQA